MTNFTENRDRFLARIGIILSSVGVVVLIPSLLVLASPVAGVFFVMLLFVVALMTLFLIFLVPEYMALLNNSDEFIHGMAKYASDALLLAIIAIGVLIVAIFFLNKDRTWHKARTALTIIYVIGIIIIVAVSIVGVIVAVMAGGTNG